MKEIEVSGKTVEEAIENALKSLGAKREEVEISILEEGSKGFLGLLGSRQARVKVVLPDSPEKVINDFLSKVLADMQIEAGIEIRPREGYYFVSFHGKDLGILIGRRGETLDALQYLTNLAVNRILQNKIRIILDVEGYRKRREQTLINLARRLSNRVKETGNRIVLEPMNPQERRVIHTALQNDSQILTFSEGQEPNRKVVIALRH
ncbi:RNA-binding cell elongation regulator Jag/EloR [Neomoorella thermoacetica]|uniref:RNA-binding protein KhpB n=3 Tax=Neomoorella thermoacetica TaxID=1525 RepID=A0A1D7XF08_NEOTH|nr:RNA-binding cell elongation regulator Jag/EloR [Moorella thermoacetica]AKX95381.1 R3H domain protein [Moorella thermoacetica]AKX98005.1 R3H domain protein [Moorella thermoacetica]AOQ25493.1 R3H domain protein [Moorella thermoacetica]OIQ10184.1 R3H domain protein [Moorella thermoacetica]OIQ54005.1 R3H domain protein [Moorella thermoacetica]